MTSAQLPDFVYRAVDFWNGLGVGRVAPDQIDPLRPNDKRKDSREVFRFRNAGPHGVHVIAKRCLDHAKSRKELALYEQMLPHLPMATPFFFGSFLEQNSGRLWLFIEDVNGEAYTRSDVLHRKLAGEWLATLHTKAADCTPSRDISEEPPDFKLSCIQAAQHIIMETIANPHLRTQDILVLQAILNRCQILESHRAAMQVLYNQLPITLTHGDFRGANMQVRSEVDYFQLVVFDWGYSRWETPLPDITKMLGYAVAPNLKAYSQIVRRRWPTWDPPMILRLGFLNEVFIALDSIRWEAEKLQYEWVEKPMANLTLYLDWLDEIIRAEPWREEARAGPDSRLPGARIWRK